MSSLRKLLSSRSNGARSRGPNTPSGKQRSSGNAITHGLLARCVVLENESQETFETLLAQYLERFQPADGVELGMVEEMVVSYWRQRRAWALEARLFENQAATQPPGDELDRMTAAFSSIAATPSAALMHRYETRLHLMYQRALHNFLLLRNLGVPNEPNPISEHSAPAIDIAPEPTHD